MIRKLLFIFLSVVSFTASGQESSAYKSKWQTKALFGANIPITTLFKGTDTDYLLQYDDHSYYWQILSLTYFFSKHWGVEFNYQSGTSNGVRNRADHFIANMQSEYSDKYYVSPSTGASYEESDFFGAGIQRGLFGVVYRLETDKFYAYPKFAIGVTSFGSDWGEIGLKEKNTNNEYKVFYSDAKSSVSNDYFTLAPSVSFGYKLFKRLYVNADIMLSYYRSGIVYEKEFSDLYTKENTIEEHINYKKNVFTLSLGAGVIFVIH